jgi:hypothetical protein
MLGRLQIVHWADGGRKPLWSIFGYHPIICFKWLTSWITSVRINHLPNRDSNLDWHPPPNPTKQECTLFSKLQFSVYEFCRRGHLGLLRFFLHIVYEMNAFWWNLVRTAFHWRLPQTLIFEFSTISDTKMTDARTWEVGVKWVLEREGGLGVTNHYLP